MMQFEAGVDVIPQRLLDLMNESSSHLSTKPPEGDRRSLIGIDPFHVLFEQKGRP
jgi:hypothetical protein